MSQEEFTSPSRRTRQQEKEELQHLNDRFVTYIDHVRKIREEKERVDSAFEHLQTTSLEESTKVKRVYDRELEDARLLIDETAKEKARFQLLATKNGEKVAGLEAEVKDLSDDLTRLQQELADARQNNEELDRQRRSANSDRVATQHKLQEVEKEADELRGQIEKLQESLEQETLAKVDLQNQIQSLKEDMAFKKRIYEEETVSLRRRTVVQSDSSRIVEETDDEFGDRLQAAIDDAREEIEKETEQYRQDLEKAYRAKLDMWEKQSRLDSSSVSKLSVEVRSLNSTISQCNRNMASLQEDKDRLEILVREKTEDLSLVKEKHAEEISQVMEEMRTLRINYEEKIKEYEELLDLRVQLEQEIATLSALLQEEEARLNISATPTREKRKRTADRDGPRSKKQKKHVASTSSSSAGFIQICDVDPEGKYVQIKNMSDKTEPIGGFKIVHEVESSGAKVEFKFHTRSKLQGGAAVTVWASGAEDAVHNPPSDIIWRSTQNWGEGPKTLTSLCTKNGEVVATFTQRKETEMTGGIDLEEMDSGSRSFPYIPESSPVRVRETESPPTSSSTPARVQQQTTAPPRPPYPQGDPDDSRRPGARDNNCVIS